MASFWEKINVNGNEMDMYASVPSSSAGFSAPYPAVVVAQHATGVDAFIQDICDRLAAGRLCRSCAQPLPPAQRGGHRRFRRRRPPAQSGYSPQRPRTSSPI